MPKIVRNEIEYSSTTSTANQINYLNTTSGLSATNVQGAIDEMYTSKTAASGGTDLSLVTTGEKYSWNNTVSKTDLVVTDSEYYGSGTTQAQAMTSIITKYGKKTLIFKFIINGDAWYEGTITFYDNTQGGGYLIRNSTTPKLYAIAIQNDTVYLSEK